MKIHDLLNFHIINDEYGNYYEIVKTSYKDDKLNEVKLSHMYYQVSFQRLLNHEDENEKYTNKHIGVLIQDIVNGRIKGYTEKNGEMFSIRDLVENGIKVEIMKLTEPHPMSKPIK